MMRPPQDAPNAPRVDVDRVLEDVRRAGDGAADAKAAKAARQTRASEADIVEALAGVSDGSPDAQRLRAGLQELGITAKAMEASLRWWRAQRRRSRPGEDEDDRPLIRVGPALHVDVAAAIVALADDPDLYYREGVLVRVTREPGAEPVIRPHTAATLRVRLTRFARWEKVGETGEPEPCIPPDAVTLGVLEAGEWSGLRPLAGLTETPTMRPDRTINQRPGYDPDTKLLYLPTTTFPPVPDEPTQDDARAALRFLWVETSHGFPFRGMGYPVADGSDPDGVLRFLLAKSHPDAWGLTSGILTILSRPAVAGDVPAHVYDASTPGSGKGLQVDVACLATVGRIPGKLTWPNTGDRGQTDAEAGKMLGGAVLEGASIIVWDEITGAFGGQTINNALTCRGRIKVRVLQTSQTPTLPYTATMLGAGNNISCRDNTHRRILMPRIEPPVENPEDKTGWRHEDLRAWVVEHRAEIVVAGLVVLRAYVCAGCPDVDAPDGIGPMPVWGGGYEDWSKLVARAIVWAGGGNVLGCRPTSDPDQRNEERDAVSVVLDTVARLEPKDDEGNPTGAGITLGSLINTLYTREQMKGDAPPDGYDDSREIISAMTDTAPGRKPPAKKLGDKIKVWKKRPIDGRMLDVTAKKDRTGVARWTVKAAT